VITWASGKPHDPIMRHGGLHGGANAARLRTSATRHDRARSAASGRAAARQ
jgi:hypothetical protein